MTVCQQSRVIWLKVAFIPTDSVSEILYCYSSHRSSLNYTAYELHIITLFIFSALGDQSTACLQVAHDNIAHLSESTATLTLSLQLQLCSWWLSDSREAEWLMWRLCCRSPGSLMLNRMEGSGGVTMTQVFLHPNVAVVASEPSSCANQHKERKGFHLRIFRSSLRADLSSSLIFFLYW